MSDSAPRVLIVDDDPELVQLVAAHLRRWGYVTEGAATAAELRASLEREPPAAVLLDVMLGEADGSALVAEIADRWPRLPVIMITRVTSLESAVDCMKRGACDYITKPLDFDRLRTSLGEVLESHRVAGELRALGVADRVPKPAGSRGLEEMIGDSEPMRWLSRRIQRVAPTDVPVLVLGETGTGKELAARAIHRLSRRSAGPFVAVNAAAVPRELIESALFGHAQGAFTGASRAHAGHCEQADGGTLFLDEIGEMGFDVQAKLLRFLQDRVVQRVGSARSRKVDVRLLAATNRDPARQIAEGSLREDLYYRLRVVSLTLPPLRERGADVDLLARHFLREASERHGRSFQAFDPAAGRLLREHGWPGNVRELENVIEEAVVLHDGRELAREMLPAELWGGLGGGPPAAEDAATAGQRRELIEALAAADGDAAAAGERLGISRATVYRRMKQFGLTRR